MPASRRYRPSIEVRSQIRPYMPRNIRQVYRVRSTPKAVKWANLNIGNPVTRGTAPSLRSTNPFSNPFFVSQARLKAQRTLAAKLVKLGFYKRARAMLPKARAYYQLKKMGRAAKYGLLKPGTNISSFK